MTTRRFENGTKKRNCNIITQVMVAVWKKSFLTVQFLFLRLQDFSKGVESIMNEKILNRSISWMFAALLLILSFIRGPIQTWILAAVFAAWAIYLAARLLLQGPKYGLPRRTDKRPKKRRAVKKQRDIPVPEETPSVLVEGSELERLLLGHRSAAGFPKS